MCSLTGQVDGLELFGRAPVAWVRYEPGTASFAYALAHLSVTVFQVRVVTFTPNVFSISAMNTGPHQGSGHTPMKIFASVVKRQDAYTIRT